ncbi:hypothetical protein ISU10_20500 [Nocardioides agariphilus]|uniref:Integral membrane protein n=1 Tax=Nocardioides agariphilus TaxID=433664 RepID=A0A930VNZ3_9ACTN|nr:hypothetical protein [Nocardioides agariphilus]MBF4770162.1 hypothetical protein [Nocardioides agariphilus]
MAEDELERRDYEALLATRQELGPDYDKALVDSFAERVEKEIQRRSFHGDDRWQAQREDARGDRQRQLALGIVSLGGGIPITAISASISGLPGLISAWAGIGVVNLAHAWVVNRRRD